MKVINVCTLKKKKNLLRSTGLFSITKLPEGCVLLLLAFFVVKMCAQQQGFPTHRSVSALPHKISLPGCSEQMRWANGGAGAVCTATGGGVGPGRGTHHPSRLCSAHSSSLQLLSFCNTDSISTAFLLLPRRLCSRGKIIIWFCQLLFHFCIPF